MGPTASGKTDLALTLAKQLPSEIISVDSALVYKNMDIGTAKPTVEERRICPHHLIDILDPSESYSVTQFCNDANQLINQIHQRGNLPILVGGTMMYFNALINGISPLPKSNEEIRQAICVEARASGWSAMHQQLQQVDPVSAARIHPNDPQRLTRALEVYRSSGKSLTYWQQQEVIKTPFEIAQFAIAPQDRAVLHERIERRFKNMLEVGFVEEVRNLYHRGDLHIDLPAIRSVGYRQVWQYLDQTLSYKEMQERGVIATRQLAKRQLTWLRGWKALDWLDTFANNNLAKILAKIDR
ncbi:tRNA (adenosine(37)-N6)-dimethylallyltransferase MiaA [Alteromonas sp. ASW11-130]|uniref:tRNA (adenosine(37)-N6)-dimethylallyltransferase MiaA n=1 Tax=Alteromonas sp. ASW11-130 TaxID=3015775 RepID=UPI0022427A0D|nr:tRNA (adenosine(37)-N6)-dimethylallyltransferase MiaA [Alteromonas sp. ASW11-130]MCW8090772.1 tRNA (adenosine(37)-N6)-dimethylallyltransferase MiaA [Alteromonas sp. ASW11-130]